MPLASATVRVKAKKIFGGTAEGAGTAVLRKAWVLDSSNVVSKLRTLPRLLSGASVSSTADARAGLDWISSCSALCFLGGVPLTHTAPDRTGFRPRQRPLRRQSAGQAAVGASWAQGAPSATSREAAHTVTDRPTVPS